MQTDKRITIKVICQGGDQKRVCLKCLPYSRQFPKVVRRTLHIRCTLCKCLNPTRATLTESSVRLSERQTPERDEDVFFSVSRLIKSRRDPCCCSASSPSSSVLMLLARSSSCFVFVSGVPGGFHPPSIAPVPDQ